jgi:hypothetical protein
VDLLGGENMLTDLRHHRVEQPGGLPNPVAQRRAVKVETFPRIDLALTIRCCAPDYAAEAPAFL